MNYLERKTDEYCSKGCQRRLFEKLELISADRDFMYYRIIKYCPVPNYMKSGHDYIETDEVWQKRIVKDA